jgi:TonB-linked SusC/RagA family outer membrane protein
VGVAWNVSREEFLKSQQWLSYLKLFGSFGKTANDNPGYFSYIQRYFDAATTYFGTGAGGNTSVAEQPLANPNIRPEKANKLNAGIQGALFNNHLGFTVEYYNMKYYDLLMQRGRNSAILGNIYPNENIGQNRYKGWEFQLNWQQDVGSLSYYVTANAALQDSKVLYIDEVTREYSWMQRTGQMVNQGFGYIAEGLYQNQDEVRNQPALEGYTPQPGDIKYKDLNGDGVINQLDVAPIGPSKPRIPYGAGLGLRWHGLDFSLLLQGALNRNIYLSGPTEWAFQNNGFGQAYEQHLDRWTPDNPDATYPRLNLGTNVNNQATSSYWLRNGDYLRLKNVELGYTVPLKLTNRVRLQGVRVFASATNALTFNQLDRIDPEAYNGAYPQQQLFNFGVNLKL